MTEKTIITVKTQIPAVRHEVHVFVKREVEGISVFADIVRIAHRESKSTTRKLYNHYAEAKKTELKVQVLTDESAMVFRLPKQYSAGEMETAALKASLSNSNSSVPLMTLIHGALRSETDSAWSDLSRVECMIRDFVGRMCKGYSSMIPKPTSSYCGLLTHRYTANKLAVIAFALRRMITHSISEALLETRSVVLLSLLPMRMVVLLMLFLH